MFKIILLVGLVGWGNTATLPDPNDLCNHLPCSLEQKHFVCTFDGENHEIFESDCALNKYNCIHKDKRLVSVPVAECLMRNIFPEPIKGEIENICEFPCTDIEQPVCGYNGEFYKIFDNACIMGKQACEDKHVWQIEKMKLCIQRSSPESKSCPEICPMNYQPICGAFGHNFTLFSNQCEMDKANCNNRNELWTKINLKRCMAKNDLEEKIPCPEICPLIYAPVCGAFGHNFTLFGNQCEMDKANCNNRNQWTRIGLKRCMAKDDLENCPKGCTRNYKPVCALNGENFKIFANECLLKVENCENHEHWAVQNMRNCQSLE